MTDVTVGVLALQGDVREHVAILEQLGAEVRLVRSPADLDAVEALVLPGGESTTLQLLLESAGLRPALGTRLAAGMPALGTCAGMILLATAVTDGRADQVPLGAIDLTVRRNGYGRQLASFETELSTSGLDEVDSAMTGVFIRAPRIERVGPGVAVLARLTEDGAELPVACRAGVVTVCAFHPELAGETRLHALLCADVARTRLRRGRSA